MGLRSTAARGKQQADGDRHCSGGIHGGSNGSGRKAPNDQPSFRTVVGRSFRKANQLTVIGRSMNLRPVPPVVLNPVGTARADAGRDAPDRLR